MPTKHSPPQKTKVPRSRSTSKTRNIDPGLSLQTIIDVLNEVKNTTADTNSILSTYMSDTNKKIDEVSSKTDKNGEKIASLEERMLKLEAKSEAASLSGDTSELSKQQALRNNICIHGVPYTEDENLNNILTLLSEAIDVPINAANYSKVYRTTSKPNNPGIIIVCFADFSKKIEILNARKAKPNLTVGDLKMNVNQTNKVYINNHLTPFFGRIHRAGRLAVNEGKLYSCWMSMNSICVRQAENSERIYIKSMKELQDLLNVESTINSINQKRKASEDPMNPSKVLKPVDAENPSVNLTNH